LPLLIEVQSDLHHASLVDRANDSSRIRRLRYAGFIVVEVWENEVWHRPRVVASRVAEARAEARTRQSANSA